MAESGEPRADGVAARQESLDRSLVAGIAWTGGIKWASQIVTWASTIVVARLLSPQDYGVVQMATLFLGLVALINEFGLGTAVVTLRHLTPNAIAQLHGLSAVAGGVGLVVSCLAAPALGAFFDTPELPPVVIVMSSTFLLSGFRVIPGALLQRSLRFGLLAGIDGAQLLATTAVTLAFAILGRGYWALVFGNLAGVATATALLAYHSWHPMARPRLHELREAITFSAHLFVSRLSWYAYSNADFLVAGRVLGQAALGWYTMAWTIANVPIEKITALVGRVTPAFFANVQADPAALRRYLLRLTEGLSLVTFPATIGIALVAPEFVPALLGEQWRGAVQPLQLLALYASFRSIVTLLPQVLAVVGETRFAMRNGIAAAVALPAAFYIGSRWGIVGVAWAWLAVHPLVTLPLYWRAFHRIQMSRSEYLAALWPALSGVVTMAVAVLLIRYLSAQGPLPVLARLALETATGAAVYGAVTVGFHRHRLQAFLRLIRRPPAPARSSA